MQLVQAFSIIVVKCAKFENKIIRPLTGTREVWSYSVKEHCMAETSFITDIYFMRKVCNIRIEDVV